MYHLSKPGGVLGIFGFDSNAISVDEGVICYCYYNYIIFVFNNIN